MPINGNRVGVPLILIFLLTLSIAGVAGVYNTARSSAIQDTITLVIDRGALDALGLKSYVVNHATLHIPGAAVLLPEKVIKDDSGGLVVVFTGIREHLKSSDITGLRISQPVLAVNIADYDSDRSYGIVVSSEALHIIDIVRERSGSPASAASVINEAVERTKSDPLYLLRHNVIHIGAEELGILEASRYVYAFDMGSEMLKYAVSGLGIRVSCDIGDPYPRPGSGVYRSVDYGRYYDMYQVPGWWYERYIDRGDGDTAEDDYHRLVMDLFASIYYADKNVFPEANSAIEAVAALIRTGHLPSPSGARDIETVMVIDVDTFIGIDKWVNTVETITQHSLPRDLLVFGYMYNTSVSEHDSRSLHVAATLSFSHASGAMGSLIFAGVPITYSDPVYVGSKLVRLSADLVGESPRRVGIIKITNYTLTLGPDSILVRWLVYDDLCEGYYVLVPIATVAPIYAIEYSPQDVVSEYSGDGSLLEDIDGVMVATSSIEWIEDKDVESPYDDERLFGFNFSAPKGPAGSVYASMIDIPPLAGVLAEMTLGEEDHGVTEAIAEVYGALTSIGILDTGESASAAYLSFNFTQEHVLSSDVYINITTYRAQAHSLLGPAGAMYNIIEIVVEYNSSS